MAIVNPNNKCFSVNHEKKKFIFFYDVMADKNTCIKRLTKYFTRGWTCISHLPNLPELAAFQSNIKPKPKYSKMWWNL